MGKIIQNSFVSEIKSFINDYSDIKKDYENKFNEPINSEPYLSINSHSLIQCKYKVSIVIPAWNTGNTILYTLRSIENTYICQKFPDKLEVIVVDDGSTDDTENKVLKNKFKFRLIYIKQQHLGRAQGINMGCKYATGEMIVFCDSDLILMPFTIDELVKRQQEYLDEAIFFGFRDDIEKKCSIKDLKSFVNNNIPKFWTDNRFSTDFKGSWSSNIMLETNMLQNLPCVKNFWVSNNILSMYDCWQLYRNVYGFLFSVSRKNFLKVGGFAEFLVGWGYDDTSFVALCLGNGIKIIPVPSAVCFHIKHPIRMRTQWEDAKKNELKMNNYLSNDKRIDFLNQDFLKRIINKIEFNYDSKKQNIITKRSVQFNNPIEEIRYHYYLGNINKSKNLSTNLLKKLSINDIENYFDCLIRSNDIIQFNKLDGKKEFECYFYYLCKLYFNNETIDYNLSIDSEHIKYLKSLNENEHLKRANQYFEEKQWYLALMDYFGNYILTRKDSSLKKCLICINKIKK